MVKSIRQKRVLLAMGTRYMDRIHHGVAHYAGRNHWHLTNLFGDDPNLIRQRDCDGIIAALDMDSPLSDVIIRRKKPTVDLSIIRQNLKMPHLTGNNRTMGRDAARHFLERGFRTFIWFSEHHHAAARQRLDGFQTELRTHGFDCIPLVIEEAFPEGLPPWNTLRTWIQKELKSRPLPCAVYTYNDNQAANLLDACIASGIRAPDEIAVLGTDNHPLICPTAVIPLSSINHDLEELGRRAAEELDNIMDGAPMERKTIVIPHQGITVRQSSDVFAINDPHVVSALRYIHEKFHLPIGVADIVNASGISRRSLELRFQAALEQTILAKLNRLRLEHACQVLKDTTLSIADIAASSGFNTPEYLHRVFLKQIGMTPRSYRMQHRTNTANESGATSEY